MAHLPIEQTDLFKAYEEVADWAWGVACLWDHRKWQAVGDQLVRSAASVNANLAEGDGRGSDADALRFFVIARASAREARLWLQRAEKWCDVPSCEVQPQLDKLTEATRSLNALIRYRRNAPPQRVRESEGIYLTHQEDTVFNEDI
ncbi:four helix bundle protein [bacterium]|nr:MAG: four helix bundle protein [bacterium]